MTKLLLAAAVALIVAGPASAASWRFEVRSWELESDGGLHNTMQRITDKAESVCGVASARTLQDIAAGRRCVAAVTEEIVAKIDHPRLTAMAQEEVRVASR